MTRYFQCEVMDHEIAEILADNPAYWIGMMLEEKPKSALACKEMLVLFNGMDGLERDEFIRQLLSTRDTARLTKETP